MSSCTCPPVLNSQKDPTVMQAEFTPAYLLGAWREDPDCPEHGDEELARHMTTAREADDHPEHRCHRCGGPNVVWAAPSPLWNAVMRGGDIGGTDLHDGIVCPTCFAVLAEKVGIAELWRLSATRVHTALKTTTPSGRVWDEQTWLWEDAAPQAYPHYTGTYCIHGLHEQCKLVCKTCEAPCLCPCGHPGEKEGTDG